MKIILQTWAINKFITLTAEVLHAAGKDEFPQNSHLAAYTNMFVVLVVFVAFLSCQIPGAKHARTTYHAACQGLTESNEGHSQHACNPLQIFKNALAVNPAEKRYNDLHVYTVFHKNKAAFMKRRQWRGFERRVDAVQIRGDRAV